MADTKTTAPKGKKEKPPTDNTPQNMRKTDNSNSNQHRDDLIFKLLMIGLVVFGLATIAAVVWFSIPHPHL